MIQSLDGDIVETSKPEKEKSDKLSPFDFVNSINYTKENLLEDPARESQYLPFIINRALSFSQDTILYANEMNKYRDLPVVMQNDFLRTIIRKRKRYDKWQKLENNDKLDTIKTFYKYSTAKAMEISDLVTDEMIVLMKKRMFTGGLRDDT